MGGGWSRRRWQASRCTCRCWTAAPVRRWRAMRSRRRRRCCAASTPARCGVRLRAETPDGAHWERAGLGSMRPSQRRCLRAWLPQRRARRAARTSHGRSLRRSRRHWQLQISTRSLPSRVGGSRSSSAWRRRDPACCTETSTATTSCAASPRAAASPSPASSTLATPASASAPPTSCSCMRAPSACRRPSAAAPVAATTPGLAAGRHSRRACCAGTAPLCRSRHRRSPARPTARVAASTTRQRRWPRCTCWCCSTSFRAR
mmetsp:Transcript_19265/g.68060  ORF Transcript_19265/g.68060 Transcript_19265/m.68060 type:complete len:260 (+) Transcript_19265:384-1163(+)